MLYDGGVAVDDAAMFERASRGREDRMVLVAVVVDLS